MHIKQTIHLRNLSIIRPNVLFLYVAFSISLSTCFKSCFTAVSYLVSSDIFQRLQHHRILPYPWNLIDLLMHLHGSQGTPGWTARGKGSEMQRESLRGWGREGEGGRGWKMLAIQAKICELNRFQPYHRLSLQCTNVYKHIYAFSSVLSCCNLSLNDETI